MRDNVTTGVSGSNSTNVLAVSGIDLREKKIPEKRKSGVRTREIK